MEEPTGLSIGTSSHDIASSVIEQFLAALKDQGVPEDVVERLRKALLTDKKPTRKALADALFAEEAIP